MLNRTDNLNMEKNIPKPLIKGFEQRTVMKMFYEGDVTQHWKFVNEKDYLRIAFQRFCVNNSHLKMSTRTMLHRTYN